MIIFLFSLFCSALAVPATKITGRFQISGFSFGGKVPGEIYLGENGEFHFRLLRPSGLSIFAMTTTTEEACFLFDLDSIQYRGTHQEFVSLSSGYLQPRDLSLIFLPIPNENTSWTWTWNNNNRKLRRISIPMNQNTNLLEIQYNQWRKDKPNRLSIHLLENDWKLKANLQRRQTVEWDFSCEPPEGTKILPLEEMKLSVPAPKKTKYHKK